MKVFSSFGVILSLALLELFHCAPFFSDLDPKLNIIKKIESVAGLGTDIRFGLNFGGNSLNSQKSLNHAVAATPLPKNFGSGSGSPYNMPNYPANDSPYYTPPYQTQYLPQPAQPFTQQPIQQYSQQQPQAVSPYSQRWPQYVQQPIQQYPLQQPQVISQNTQKQPLEAASTLVQEVQPTRVVGGGLRGRREPPATTF